MKKIIITGNIGKDPAYRADKNGGQFVVFNVAVNSGSKSNQQTDWIDVTCIGKTGEYVIQYLKKGNKILVEGTPSVNVYINKENKAVGNLRIFANIVESFSRNEDKEDNGIYELPEIVKSASSLDDLNDIPF